MPTFHLPKVLTISLLVLGGLACTRDKAASSPPPPPAPSSAQKPATAARPAISFDERVHDFGVVNEGTVLKHKFVIKNTGKAVLKIENVSTSCGCTAATAGVDEIPPGGSGPLEVTFHTNLFSGPGSKGIQVATNDPRNPTSSLEIKYDVQRLLRFESPFVSLTTKRGRDHVERLWLTGNLVDQAKLRVVKLQGVEQVTAKPIQARKDGKLRKGLELKLKGGTPVSASGEVILSTGLPNPAELVLRFSATVEG